LSLFFLVVGLIVDLGEEFAAVPMRAQSPSGSRLRMVDGGAEGHTFAAGRSGIRDRWGIGA